MELEKKFAEALETIGVIQKSTDKFIAEQAALVKEGKESSAEAVKLGQETAENLEKALSRVKELEQKTAEAIERGTTKFETVGDLFAKSQQVKDFFEGKTARARFETDQKLDVLGVKNTITQSDATTAPQRNAGIIPGSFRRLTVRDIVPTMNTTANVIEGTREATATLAAAETAEGSAKPESALTFELVTTNIRTIAHWLKISKQLAADAPALASYINTRMAYGVDKRIDSQIVNGGGTGSDLSGITKSGNYTAFTPVSGFTKLDGIAAMIAQLEAADYYATGILLNPTDLWAINTLKDSQGNYIFGNPHAGPMNGLWGLPTVASNAVPVGKAIVADFFEAYQFWLRQSTIVEMFEQDDDNVQKNLVTIRAEARGGLESRLPAAALYGYMQA